MEIVGGGLVLIGICIAVIADLMIIIQAFKKSLLWGFGTLFIPIVGVIFIILNWGTTKKYVFWILISIPFLLVGGTLYNLR